MRRANLTAEQVSALVRHQACPACGSTDISRKWQQHPLSRLSVNERLCCRCGWEGRVCELVADKEDGK